MCVMVVVVVVVVVVSSRFYVCDSGGGGGGGGGGGVCVCVCVSVSVCMEWVVFIATAWDETSIPVAVHFSMKTSLSDHDLGPDQIFGTERYRLHNQIWSGPWSDKELVRTKLVL